MGVYWRARWPALILGAAPWAAQTVRIYLGCPSAPGALLEDLSYGQRRLSDSSVAPGPGEVLADADYLRRARVVFAGWETTHFQAGRGQGTRCRMKPDVLPRHLPSGWPRAGCPHGPRSPAPGPPPHAPVLTPPAQGDLLVGSPAPPASGGSAQATSLTLALLKDSGWYAVAVNGQGYWGYAQGAGCAFATSHCASLLTAGAVPASSAICNATVASSSASGCAWGSAAVGRCVQSSPFVTPGCGLLSSPTPGVATCLRKEAELLTLSAGDPTAAPVFGWASGYSSRCTPLRWPWSVTLPTTGAQRSWPPDLTAASAAQPGASCFPARCSTSGELSYSVAGTWVTCPSGALVNVTAQLPTSSSSASSAALRGALLGPCPDNAALCASLGCAPATCSPRGGECRAGKCYCRPSFGGPSCASDLLSGLSEDLAGQTSAYSLVEVCGGGGCDRRRLRRMAWVGCSRIMNHES